MTQGDKKQTVFGVGDIHLPRGLTNLLFDISSVRW
jgi:hypothetical protein